MKCPPNVLRHADRFAENRPRQLLAPVLRPPPPLHGALYVRRPLVIWTSPTGETGDLRPAHGWCSIRRVGALVTAGIAVAVGLAAAAAGTGVSSGQAAVCTSFTDPASVVGGPLQVYGYTGDQLENALTIVAAAHALGLSTRAEVIGVMTAMGESSLHNLDHGDEAVNPDGSQSDSVGLFQQQHWWESLQARLTPITSATAFFRHLVTIPGWASLPPTIAAHAVQGNADPEHYAYYDAALAVVGHLSRVNVPAGGCPAIQTHALHPFVDFRVDVNMGNVDISATANGSVLDGLAAAGGAFRSRPW